MEDIAAAAGKTRGAFYANFEDKEDVFFAIFEEDLSRDREQVSLQLSEPRLSRGADRALARHLASMIKTGRGCCWRWNSSSTPSAIRANRSGWPNLHAALCARMHGNGPGEAAAGIRRCPGPAQKRCAVGANRSHPRGLALNCMFDRGSLSEEQVLRQIPGKPAPGFGDGFIAGWMALELVFPHRDVLPKL